jgi:hypothetical protein
MSLPGGCMQDEGGPEDELSSEIRESLRTIAGLYLRADVSGIQTIIDHYNLAIIFAQYLMAQYIQSPTSLALGLQRSRAVAMHNFASCKASDEHLGTARCPSRGASSFQCSPSVKLPSGHDLSTDCSGHAAQDTTTDMKGIGTLQCSQILDVQSAASSALQRSRSTKEALVPVLGSSCERHAKGSLDAQQCLQSFGSHAILLHLMQVSCFRLPSSL